MFSLLNCFCHRNSKVTKTGTTCSELLLVHSGQLWRAPSLRAPVWSGEESPELLSQFSSSLCPVLLLSSLSHPRGTPPEILLHTNLPVGAFSGTLIWAHCLKDKWFSEPPREAIKPGMDNRFRERRAQIFWSGEFPEIFKGRWSSQIGRNVQI